jgi:hypothetical protein
MSRQFVRHLGTVTLVLGAVCAASSLQRAASQTGQTKAAHPQQKGAPQKDMPQKDAPQKSVPPNQLSNVPSNSPGAPVPLRSTLPPTSTWAPPFRSPPGMRFGSSHKETVGYSVADLVVPIPNSLSPLALQQSATLFGQFGLAGGFGGQPGYGGFGAQGFAGLSGMQFGALGTVGGFAGVGGGQPAYGFAGLAGNGGAPGPQFGFVGGDGAFGALGTGGYSIAGIGGGQLGAVGGMQFGAPGRGPLGALGGNGAQGAANFGIGGGFSGFGGGQLGQFGNLGGQFGLQGGTQDAILILTIRSLIGTPGDWAPTLIPPGNDPGTPSDLNLTNTLGFFPPARLGTTNGFLPWIPPGSGGQPVTQRRPRRRPTRLPPKLRSAE